MQLFFDNEPRNVEAISKMGVVCIHTPDGLTDDKWKEGLETFANKSAAVAN